MHLARYADTLRVSSDRHDDARRYLLRAMRFDPGYAPAYHVLADMLFTHVVYDEAELTYPLASSPADGSTVPVSWLKASAARRARPHD